MRKQLKAYKKLGFSLVSLSPGTKNPHRTKWNIKSGSDEIKSRYNVGLKHKFSSTCCIDIDDLKALKKHKLWKHLRKHMGIRWTSGKKNRLKILYKVPSMMLHDIISVRLPNGSGSINSTSLTGRSLQDVLPPSRLDDGREYYWIDPLPKKFRHIPELPLKVIKYITKQLSGLIKKRKSIGKGIQISPYPWTQAFNEWFVDSGESFNHWMEMIPGYERGPKGWRRIGSTSSHNLVIHEDFWAMNFSSNDSQLLPNAKARPQPISPWDLCVAIIGTVDEARRYVCNGNFDKEMKQLGISSDVKERIDMKLRGQKPKKNKDGTFSV